MLLKFNLILLAFVFIGLSPSWGQSFFLKRCNEIKQNVIPPKKQIYKSQFLWLKYFFNTDNCSTLESKIKDLKSFSEFIPYNWNKISNIKFTRFKPFELEQPSVDYYAHKEEWQKAEYSFSTLTLFREFENLKHYNYGTYNRKQQSICKLIHEVPSVKSLTIFSWDLSEQDTNCIAKFNLKIHIQNNFSPNQFSENFKNNIYGIDNFIGNIEELSDYTNLSFLGLGDYSGKASLKSLARIKNLSNLHINIRNVSHPEDISNLIYLKYLSINCFETRFPQVPSSLSERRCKKNFLTNINFLRELKYLKGLNLSWNQISDISPISHLHSLHYLEIRHNLVNTIPSLKDLTELKYLDIAANRLKDITNIQDASKIKLLNLAGNQISKIAEVSKLRDLTYLSIGNNPIADFEAFSPSPTLKMLNLDSNAPFKYNLNIERDSTKVLLTLANSDEERLWPEKLMYEDMETYVLNAPKSLNHLNISDLNFASLKNLEALSLSGNIVNDITFIKSLKNLRYLEISSSFRRIKLNPELLPGNIEFINLRGSLDIEEFNIDHLPKLRYLDLGSNNIERPENIALASNSLIILRLDNCNLKHAPKLLLPKLEVLNLSSNLLTYFSVKKLSEISSLKIGKNKLEDIPKIYNAKNLKYLDLSQNRLKVISHSVTLETLALNNSILNLSRNHIKDLSAFENFDSRKIGLVLTNNPIDKNNSIACPTRSRNWSVQTYCLSED